MTSPGSWPSPQPTPPPPFGPPPQSFGPGAPQQPGTPTGWRPPAAPPPAAPQQYGWQPQPPKRSRLKWIITALTAAIVAVGAAGIWGYRHHQHEQQLAHIRDAINAFAEASDTADTRTMTWLMCTEEAEQFADGFTGVRGDGPIEPAERRPVNIGVITVTGDDATVEVTRPPAPTITLKLRRENGNWMLCNPS